MSDSLEESLGSLPVTQEKGRETPLLPNVDDNHKRRRRLATVYDAVAGKVSSQKPLRADQIERSIASTEASGASEGFPGGTPFAPDEVLFRRRDAPERYAEHDIYYSNERDLPRGGQGVLPESDLLKAIHGYSSRFYGAMERDQRHTGEPGIDSRSMDETALLAFGILLEEAGRNILGRHGDLVFTEAAEVSDGGSEDEASCQPPQGQQATERRPKRRKTTKSETAAQ